MRLPQLLLAPCELLHPQSHNGSDQVVDFTTFCTLILPLCRIRFTCAVCSSLPIASFRPCRYQQRPCDSDCLPPGQGDICFFQQTGGASHAGQTKGRAKNPAFYKICPFEQFKRCSSLLRLDKIPVHFCMLGLDPPLSLSLPLPPSLVVFPKVGVEASI